MDIMPAWENSMLVVWLCNLPVLGQNHDAERDYLSAKIQAWSTYISDQDDLLTHIFFDNKDEFNEKFKRNTSVVTSSNSRLRLGRGRGVFQLKKRQGFQDEGSRMWHRLRGDWWLLTLRISTQILFIYQGKGFGTLEVLSRNHPDLNKYIPAVPTRYVWSRLSVMTARPHLIYAVQKFVCSRVVDNYGVHGPIDLGTRWFLSLHTLWVRRLRAATEHLTHMASRL